MRAAGAPPAARRAGEFAAPTGVRCNVDDATGVDDRRAHKGHEDCSRCPMALGLACPSPRRAQLLAAAACAREVESGT